MATEVLTNPHLTDDYSPLEALAMQALRRYGAMHPGTVEGDVLTMMVEFANEIIDTVNSHPYRDGFDEVKYYKAVQDKRPVHDTIIRLGLLHKYAAQQASSKAEAYGQLYISTMNSILYRDAFGTEQPQLKAVDKKE